MRRCFKIALLVLSYEGKLKKSRNLFHKTSIILWQEKLKVSFGVLKQNDQSFSKSFA